MKTSLLSVVFSLLAAATPSPAAAGDPPPAAGEGPADESELRALLGTKVETASKIPQSVLEAPSVVSLVTRRTIEAYGWQTLNDVLYAQPGFFPSQQAERVTVGARGLFEPWYANHLLLLVDGVPFGDAETGAAYTWSVTPLTPWSAVEIVRGPGSALYGSGAVNGVISLRTPSAEEAASHGGRAALRFGEAGTISADVSLAGASRLAAGYVAFQYGETSGNAYLDYDGSGRTQPDGSLARFPIGDRRRSSFAIGKIEGKGPLAGLSLQVHHQEWYYQTGHGWAYMIPDAPDSNHEWRDMAFVRYQSPASERLSADLVFRVQRHGWDTRVRLYPAGATVGGITYPEGADEQSLFFTDDLFARAQLTWRLPGDASLLGGVEYSGLLTHRDVRHTANFDAGGTWEPLPEGERRVGDYYQQILGHPFNRAAAYVQGVSGRFLGGLLSLTGGLRWDMVRGRYHGPDGSTHETYREQQWSPRLAAVFTPADRLSLKLAAAQAFRAPVVGELFAANTGIQISNADTLRPERLRTLEAIADWLPTGRLAIRANGYLLRAENVVGFNGLYSANLYDRDAAGLELEVQTDVDLGGAGRLAGFASYSYARLLSEKALEQPAGAQPIDASNRLTWAPAHTAKAGLNWQRGALSLAGTLRYQGSVERRPSDLATPEYRAVRPDRVAPWATVDVNATWQVARWARLGIGATNVLGSGGRLFHAGDYPFDYRIEGRRVMGSIIVEP